MAGQLRKSWLGRNWFWAVPVGCLGMLAVAVGFIALILVAAFSLMKSSGAYEQGVAQAKASPAVQAALGTPIEEGLLVTGNVSVNDGSGEASLSVPLSGPNDSGTLYLEAQKSTGQWTFSTLILDTGESRIDVLSETGSTTW